MARPSGVCHDSPAITILAWHRKLVALKYTAKRKINTARQERMTVIRELCVKFAEENLGWGYGRIQGALSNVGYDISMTTVPRQGHHPFAGAW